MLRAIVSGAGVLVLALLRTPLGTDQDQRASGPLERAEAGLSAIRQRLQDLEEGLQNTLNGMVATSINEILTRSGIQAQFEGGVDVPLFTQCRTLINALSRTVPGDEPVPQAVAERHLAESCYYMMSQLVMRCIRSWCDVSDLMRHI